jgi:hypothetical protein
MLHHLYRQHIMTALLLVWIYAVCCRLLQPRHGRRLQALHNSCLILLVLCFAYAHWLSFCVVAVAITVTRHGGLFDSLGLLAALTLAHEGWIIAAIALTVVYTVWAINSSKLYRQPDFATFLVRLRPSPPAPKTSEEDEDRGCLICWSSEEIPLQLPCHKDHRFCKDCLSRLYNADKYCCPFCLKSLFRFKSGSYRSCLRYIITTNFILRLTFRSIVLALQLYKGYYCAAAKMVFFTVLCAPLTLGFVGVVSEDGHLADHHIAFFWFMLGLTTYNVWSAALAMQTWDQVTLWDGAVLKGVEVWDTHSVVRDWYAAATAV